MCVPRGLPIGSVNCSGGFGGLAGGAVGGSLVRWPPSDTAEPWSSIPPEIVANNSLGEQVLPGPDASGAHPGGLFSRMALPLTVVGPCT